MITLDPHVNFHLDLSQHGVPADARVLYMSYTPQGAGLFPIEWHGNVPDHRPALRKILVPIEITGPEKVGPTKVAVMAAWVPSQSEGEPWSEFVRALESHAVGDLEGAIVPASAATENAVMGLARTVLEEQVSAERVESFLRSTGFSQQLNVVLPTLAGLLKIPFPSNEIRGSVNRLRELRNQMAHRGKPDAPITERESATCLAAALLTHRYAQLVRVELQHRANEFGA